MLTLLGGIIMYKNQQKKEVATEVTRYYEELMSTADLSKATFSGGCFWCMEGPFESMEGVEEVISGFAGGKEENPTYKQVVSGTTGHRESVQVFYDPTKVRYQQLLEIYWRQIDPTDAGGQFADRGEHYTTAIFYHDEAQRQEADKQILSLNESGIYDGPIVTKVLPYSTFYPAEDYHQDFYKKSSEHYKSYAEGSGRTDYIKAMEDKYPSDE